MILGTRAAKEMNNLELIHGVLPLEIAVTVLAFWTRDAEAPASSDASASCYGVTEDVLVLAVVKAKLKLRKIERQILFADMMVGPYHAALEQAPEVFQIVGVHFAAHVLTRAMAYRLMRETKGVGKVAINSRNVIMKGKIAPMKPVCQGSHNCLCKGTG